MGPDHSPIPSPKTTLTEQPTRRTPWLGLLTVALLVLVTWLASVQTGLPRPLPASAPDTSFSAERALSVVEEMARAPHPAGSPEHARVRGVVMDRIRGLGVDPEVQTSPSLAEEGGVVRSGTMRNVVARVPGTAPTGALLITAHYDANDQSHGAADDASGVAVILEALRAVQARGPLRNDLIVLVTDGEEVGLLGARAFVDRHPWARDVSLVLSFEMRGSAGPSIMFETADQNGWVVRALDAFAQSPQANSMSYEVYERLPNSTDFTPFAAAGEQGLNFAVIGNGHVYHQANDVPANLSQQTLQQHGENALGALLHFGEADLGVVSAPNVTYFDAPLLGLVVYRETWVPLISVLIVVLAALAGWTALRRGARVLGVVLGFLFAMGTLVVSAAFGFVLLRVLSRFHGEMGSLEGSAVHSEGWYVIALAAAAFAVATAALGLARRWVSSAELALGGILLPMVGAGMAGFAAPLAAMNLQWPVVAALVAAILVSRRALPASQTTAASPPSAAHASSASAGWAEWAATVALAAVVLVLLVPVIELLWMAMTIRLAVVLSALFGVLLWLCIPALEPVIAWKEWWAPSAGLVVAFGAVGLGLSTARPSAERPSPSTLVYALDPAADSAMWLTEPSLHPRDAEALEWVYERAGRDFSGRRDFSDYGYLSGTLPFAAAPEFPVSPPEVSVVRDTLDGARRNLRVRVRSTIGAEMMLFRYPQNGATRLLSINGLPLAAPERLRWADHWGVPEGGIELELELAAGEPIALDLVEHLLRPQELLGTDTFARPPHLAPNTVWMSDRAMIRYALDALIAGSPE